MIKQILILMALGSLNTTLLLPKRENRIWSPITEKGKCSHHNHYSSFTQQYFNSLSIGFSMIQVTKIKIKVSLFHLCCVNLFVVQINLLGLVLSPNNWVYSTQKISFAKEQVSIPIPGNLQCLNSVTVNLWISTSSYKTFLPASSPLAT